jgi:hypothetical protein
MKDILTKFGAVTVALAMSGLPAIAFAEGSDSERIQVTSIEAQTVESRTSADIESTREGQKQTAEVPREQQKQGAEVSREQAKQQLEASSSEQGRPSVKGDREDDDFELEDDSDRAVSSDDLNRKIEMRKRALDREAASSTPNRKDIVENANPVRLAVHSLLASKDLLGGIGSQVSEIAKEMNHSVASTTDAEVKIKSRGFLSRLLFGGDKTSAEMIASEAAQNQTRIDSLTALLGQADVAADVQATLTAQITALKDAQERLKTLADREKSAWGLFSWRF